MIGPKETSAIDSQFYLKTLLSDETHFRLKGYVNKQNDRIWSDDNPQAIVRTLLSLQKLTVVWCNSWAGESLVHMSLQITMVFSYLIAIANVWFQQDGDT